MKNTGDKIQVKAPVIVMASGHEFHQVHVHGQGMGINYYNRCLDFQEICLFKGTFDHANTIKGCKWFPVLLTKKNENKKYA